MKIEKRFETILDLADTNDVFCGDLENKLLILLKNKFNGRCYKSAYIEDVKAIIERSPLYCKPNSLDGSLSVTIGFTAACIVYETGEVLHNCSVITVTDKDTIIAKTSICSIGIRNVTKIDIFKAGDIIPVVINMVKYTPFEVMISASAVPLIPIPKPEIIYVVEGNEVLPESSTIGEIKELEQKISTFDNKAIKFFTNLLYPKKLMVPNEKYGKKIKLSAFDQVVSGDSIYVGNKLLNDDTFIKLEANHGLNGALVNIGLGELYLRLLHDYKLDLINLLGFLENYTMEKIRDSSTVWSLYTKLKI